LGLVQEATPSSVFYDFILFLKAKINKNI